MNDSSRPAAPDPRPWTFVGLAAFVACVWLATLSARPLFNPDEGRYAEIPREMLAGGDWVIPHLNGLAYIEKPPLQYWATALSLRLFGDTEFAARLYTALCALGACAAVWTIARALWGSSVAWRAAAVMSSLILFVILGQLLTLDMSLTLYMTLALGGFLVAQARSAPALPETGGGETAGAGTRSGPLGAGPMPMLIAWIATALGVLTKGPVAAVIPSAVLVLYSGYTRDFGPWRRLRLSWGLPLFLAIAVPWHWLAARRLPDFLEFFFVHEHVARYLTPSADREEAWWFFIVVFLLGTLPWTLAALRVVAVAWRRDPSTRQFQPKVFLWIWMMFVCVFFSLSDSKLIPYILPALPAVALLIASSPLCSLRRDVRLTAVVTLIAAVLLGAASVWAPHVVAPTVRNGYFLQLARPLLEVAALLGVSALFVLSKHRDLTRAAVFLGVGWCLAGILLMRAAAWVAPIYSGVALARALPDPGDAPLFSVAVYDQTLPFYWRRTFQLVSYRGELDFGLRHDPAAELPSLTDFLARWRTLPEGYAVMEIRMFDVLRGLGVPMREVGRDLNRVLVARR